MGWMQENVDCKEKNIGVIKKDTSDFSVTIVVNKWKL